MNKLLSSEAEKMSFYLILLIKNIIMFLKYFLIIQIFSVLSEIIE